MTALAELQTIFQGDILRSRGKILSHLSTPPRGDTARRLGVYADAYRSRLVEALANDYPALQRLLGKSDFEGAAHAFIVTHRSRLPNLRWYGGGLARFLSRMSPWRRRPLLADLARFEWALGLAFDAADAPVAMARDVSAVAPADWPRLRLRLHPSVTRLTLRTNAPQVWRAAVRAGRKLRPRARRGEWVVWRKGLEPFYRELAADEAWALDAVARGRSFAFLCSGLQRFNEHAARRGTELLRNWLAAELICGLGAGEAVRP